MTDNEEMPDSDGAYGKPGSEDPAAPTDTIATPTCNSQRYGTEYTSGMVPRRQKPFLKHSVCLVVVTVLGSIGCISMIVLIYMHSRSNDQRNVQAGTAWVLFIIVMCGLR